MNDTNINVCNKGINNGSINIINDTNSNNKKKESIKELNVGQKNKSNIFTFVIEIIKSILKTFIS